MLIVLCRNRVQEFETWKEVFDSHTQSHIDAGLTLINMWRDTADLNNIFFTFEVSDKKKAIQFMNSPSSVEAGRVSGVLDGEVHFLVNA
ncbi:MAG TPA: hypothetical protein VIN10_13060 [Bacteroidales bacterium]